MKHIHTFESFFSNGIKESLNEGAISNLYVLADQEKNLEDFIKAALKEYDMLKDDRATREFLKEIYDEAKNMK